MKVKEQLCEFLGLPLESKEDQIIQSAKERLSSDPDGIREYLRNCRASLNRGLQIRNFATQAEAREGLAFLDRVEKGRLGEKPPAARLPVTEIPQEKESAAEEKVQEGQGEIKNGPLKAGDAETQIESRMETTSATADTAAGLAAKLPPVTLVKGPTKLPWWLTPGAIVVLFFAPLLSQLKSSAVEHRLIAAPLTSHGAKPALRLGLYDWPSIVVHYSVVANSKLGIELTSVHETASLIPKPDGPEIPFDLIVVPFATAVENSEAIKEAGWRLVWVCDESNGMDRVMVNRNVQNERDIVAEGRWLTVTGTQSAHALDAYLDNTLHPEKKRSHAGKRFLPVGTAEKLLEQVESEEEDIMVVAIHEPWADSHVFRDNENNFVDDTVFAVQNHAGHEVNVVLARKAVFEDPGLRKILVRFLKKLLDYPSNPDAKKIFDDDGRLRDDFSFTKMELDARDEQRILSYDRPAKLKDNLEFLFGFGPFSCNRIAKDQIEHISWKDEDSHSPCSDLIEKAERDRLITDLQKDVPNPPKFEEDELKDMCSSEDATGPAATLAPFVLGQSSPALRWGGSASPAEQLKRRIGSDLNATGSYCIVGHGDDTGSVKRNEELGRDRANNIKQLLANRIYRFSPDKLVTISRGNENPADPIDQDKNRRVEIRVIHFEIGR